MGNELSKIFKKSQPKTKEKIPKPVDEYEDIELMLLKKAIEQEPESFILNNLMMCIQFFENYEEDISQIKETLKRGSKLSDEAELNKVMPPQKSILLPHVLQNCIARNIDFTSKRQTGDLIIEPLQPVRIYIAHDNIEITEQDYLSEYSSLNNEVTYNMMVQESDNPGYVRLRRLDETPYRKNLDKKDIGSSSIADDEEIYEDGESIYDLNRNPNTTPSHQIKRNSRQSSAILSIRSLPNLHDDQVSLSHENIYIGKARSNYSVKIESDRNNDHTSLGVQPGSVKSARQKGRGPPSITSSGYDSDCGYPTVTATRNREKTSVHAPTKIYSNAMIPSECFKKVRINNEGKIYSMREERWQAQNSKQHRLMMAARQYDCEVFYTSSETFMNYFVDLFVDQLAEPLGFKPEDLNHVQDSIIHCDKVINTHIPSQYRIDSYEVTPTIWLQWPKYAEEWLDRARSTWPHDDDIGRVRAGGCFVVPENSLSKKMNAPPRGSRQPGVRKSIDQKIEWQLAFPAAERYLETCMTRSQMQVYLIALMLHKMFLRPVLDTMYGLTTAHIRHKMFWLIEKYDTNWKWPDNRTGQRLIHLLNTLYHCISQNEPILPDYFVRSKNMFQKVPRDYLLYSQKQLKRIIENPVMYVFYALENIQYSEQFFPKLNFSELFKILTVRPCLPLVNPALDPYMLRTTEQPYRDEIYDSANGGICDRNRKKNSRYTYGVNKTLITPRKATDSIVEISERCAELKGPRLAALLDFFVNHFIKMAECCHRYRAYEQKKVYLDQADRLSTILSDYSRHKEDAKAYHNKINALRMKATISTRLPDMRRMENEPPETPKRNLEPIFVGPLRDRFTRHVNETLTTNEQQMSEEQLQSENLASNKVTKAATHEIRFKEEKNAQATTETKDDEDPYSSENSRPKDQSEKAALSRVQTVVFLNDNLNETTYM
ncbi:uncharacterized protein [Linepithema humile]|uniref:uncharacterized protein n=1 Tax=Linepithema humile TaxID=83485 RepID=UPI0006230AF4|nr:PREDICTED: uncharacterized protein LOC105675394 [Linepithema humile]